jgi:hypothetical protein
MKMAENDEGALVGGTDRRISGLDLLSQCQLNGAEIFSNGHGTWTCDVVSAGDVSVDDLLVEAGRKLALACGSIRLMRGRSPIVRAGSVTRTDPGGRVATIIRPGGFATVNAGILPTETSDLVCARARLLFNL